MTEILKRIISSIYSSIIDLINFLYDSGLIDQQSLHVPVVAVGNISSGGAGKTPFVDYLITYFESKNKRVGVVSKNYKAKVNFTEEINTQQERGASFYGDEAWMLSQKHPQAVFYVSPLKWYAAWKLVQKHAVDVVVVDDAFQHRALKRDLDIVLIDATTSEKEEKLLPLGKARESYESLVRADVVVMTKCNWADSEALGAKLKRIPIEKPLVRLTSNLEFEKLDSKSVWAFAGTANPQQFKSMLETEANLQIVGFDDFPDHYNYRQSDIDLLETKAANCEVIYTTEKDFVKIKDLKISSKFKFIPLKINVEQGGPQLHAILDQLFS